VPPTMCVHGSILPCMIELAVPLDSGAMMGLKAGGAPLSDLHV
jgi:hypothetical protein